MARSSYIYMVTEGNPRIIVAAFTVKHECQSWLRRFQSASVRKVIRTPDGRSGEQHSWSEEDFINV